MASVCMPCKSRLPSDCAEAGFSFCQILTSKKGHCSALGFSNKQIMWLAQKIISRMNCWYFSREGFQHQLHSTHQQLANSSPPLATQATEFLWPGNKRRLRAPGKCCCAVAALTTIPWTAFGTCLEILTESITQNIQNGQNTVCGWFFNGAPLTFVDQDGELPLVVT